MNPGEDRIRVKDVMLRRYLRLGEVHTLNEVMGFLTNKHFEKDGLPFLMVIAEDGSFAGTLEPKTLLRALMEGVQEGEAAEASLAEAARVNLDKQVGHIMNRNVPTLSPQDHLEEAFRCLAGAAAEVAAVVEDGRVIGLISARLLFEQASALTVESLRGGVIPPPGG